VISYIEKLAKKMMKILSKIALKTRMAKQVEGNSSASQIANHF
jgi:hypothetical protein